MIVAMQDRATEEEIQAVVERMMEIGFNVHRTTGTVQTILAGVGTPGVFEHQEFEVLAGVAEVIRISSPYKLAGRSFRPEGTIVRFPNGVSVGGGEVVVMAGPCSVENREQIFSCAKIVKTRARNSSAAAPSSHAARPIPSRALASMPSSSSAKQATLTACSSSARSWKSPRSSR